MKYDEFKTLLTEYLTEIEETDKSLKERESAVRFLEGKCKARRTALDIEKKDLDDREESVKAQAAYNTKILEQNERERELLSKQKIQIESEKDIFEKRKAQSVVLKKQLDDLEAKEADLKKRETFIEKYEAVRRQEKEADLKRKTALEMEELSLERERTRLQRVAEGFRK